MSFRTQFRASTGRVPTSDPRKGSRHCPAGAELAECELHRQQAIDRHGPTRVDSELTEYELHQQQAIDSHGPDGADLAECDRHRV